MKAHVKVNIQIQFESEASAVGTDAKEALVEKYPLSAHHAGVIEVTSFGEGERVVESLANHIRTTFVQMGVKAVLPGLDFPFHKPDLTAAHGGLPEPKREHGLTSDVADEKVPN